MVFSTEKDDYWWWLMQNGDVNTARLDAQRHGRPRLERRHGPPGQRFHGRQQRGAWHTTTANLWGGLALEKFSAKFEAVRPWLGSTKASAGHWKRPAVDWSKVERIKLPMPPVLPTRPATLAHPPRPAACATTACCCRGGNNFA
jgi:hypothetical protein